MPTLSLPTPSTAELAPCPPQLSPAQVEQYHRDGFVAFRSVLSADEVQQAKDALSRVVEMLRTEHTETASEYGTAWADPNSPLLIQFQRGHEPKDAQDLAAIEKVRKFFYFVGQEPYLTHLAREQANVQNILTSLIGSESTLSQDMALMNPPGIGTGKPWHQDDAYFKIAPLEAVCGVWIALDDVGVDNGCMNFLPGWHRRGALRHYHGSDCEIMPERLAGAEQEVVPVPLPAGGAVFFNGVAPHMTKPNASSMHRRALQYHYRSQDSRLVTDAEYDALFSERDGTPASCAAATQRGF